MRLFEQNGSKWVIPKALAISIRNTMTNHCFFGSTQCLGNTCRTSMVHWFHSSWFCCGGNVCRCHQSILLYPSTKVTYSNKQRLKTIDTTLHIYIYKYICTRIWYFYTQKEKRWCWYCYGAIAVQYLSMILGFDGSDHRWRSMIPTWT